MVSRCGLVVILALMSAGCASERPPAQVVSAKPAEGASATATPAPRGDVYQVVMITADHHTTLVPNTRVYLRKGEALAFKPGEGNHLLAIAGEYQFDVTPSDAETRLAWARVGKDDPSRVVEHGGAVMPASKDDLPGKRDGIIETIVTDPSAFTR